MGRQGPLSVNAGPEFDDDAGRCRFLLARPRADYVLAAALRGDRASRMQITMPKEKIDWDGAGNTAKERRRDG